MFLSSTAECLIASCSFWSRRQVSHEQHNSAFLRGLQHRQSSGNYLILCTTMHQAGVRFHLLKACIVPRLKQTFIASINNPCVFFLSFLSCHQKPGRDNEPDMAGWFSDWCWENWVIPSPLPPARFLGRQTNCTLILKFCSCEDATLMRASSNPWVWCWSCCSCCDRTEASQWRSLGQEE